MSSYRIGQVARRSGVAPSAIRYYERIGLLPPARRVGGKRRFGAAVLTRLELIRAGKALGFSLAEIRTLLDGMDEDAPARTRLRRLARAKLPEVEATLRRARVMRRLLRQAADCGCPDLEDCLELARECGVVEGASGA